MTRRQQIKQMVKETVEKYLHGNHYSIFLFGSQANSKKLLAADFDIGIDAGAPIPYELMSKIRFTLNEDLPTLFTFDVVDFSTVKKSFRKIALENTEPIA